MKWPWTKTTPHNIKASITESQESTMFGSSSEIPMSTLVEHYRTDPRFHAIVTINVSMSVGAGYYLSADESVPAARKNKKLIEEWCQEQDLDTLNQDIATDVWMSGNCFLEPRAAGKSPTAGIIVVPLSSIDRISRDESGIPISYHQTWGTSHEDIPADDIMHFRWRPIDNGAWGEGLGQIMARRGRGYKLPSGKMRYRESIFDVNEKRSDYAIKMLEAGLPRWVMSGKGIDDKAMAGIKQFLEKLDPLQHAIINEDIKIDTISLETKSAEDQTRMDRDETASVVSPVLNLWDDMSFTYASSKEAMDAISPLMDMYKRAHKRFIEQEIFRRIITESHSERSWLEGPVEINWGNKEMLGLDEIWRVFAILRDPSVSQYVDVADIFGMLQERGINVTPRKPKPTSPQLAALKKTLSAGNDIDQEKIKTLQAIRRNYENNR